MPEITLFRDTVAATETGSDPVTLTFADLDAALRGKGLVDENPLAQDLKAAVTLAAVERKPMPLLNLGGRMAVMICMPKLSANEEPMYGANFTFPTGVETCSTTDLDHAASWLAKKVWAEYFCRSIVPNV